MGCSSGLLNLEIYLPSRYTVPNPGGVSTRPRIRQAARNDPSEDGSVVAWRGTRLPEQPHLFNVQNTVLKKWEGLTRHVAVKEFYSLGLDSHRLSNPSQVGHFYLHDTVFNNAQLRSLLQLCPGIKTLHLRLGVTTEYALDFDGYVHIDWHELGEDLSFHAQKLEELDIMPLGSPSYMEGVYPDSLGFHLHKLPGLKRLRVPLDVVMRPFDVVVDAVSRWALDLPVSLECLSVYCGLSKVPPKDEGYSGLIADSRFSSLREIWVQVENDK